VTAYWNQEWLVNNGQRSYPLAESATKLDTTGSISIVDSFLLALYFPVHSGLNVAADRFYLARLSIFPTGYNISLGYDDGSASPPIVATAVVARDAHSEYDSYALPGVGDFDDCVGKLVVGRLDDVDLLPPGEYTFDRAGGRLDTDCIRPMLRGLSSLTVINGGVASPKLYGDIRLIAGSNMRISVAAVGGVVEVRLDALDGSGLTEECSCDGASKAPPLRTINGVAPDADGNIDILGSACTSVEGAGSSLTISDTCATPCCGCPELQKLTDQIQHFGDERVTLQAFVRNLAAQHDTMNTIVLGSRTSDFPCVSC
jgi:hypothetical protein